MVRRIAALLALAWFFGFVWFAVMLPGPAGTQRTDAVVVFTGGEGRVDRGLEAVRRHWARQLLVSGVDREVRPREFRAEYEISRPLLACCITLGFESFDTRSNALETSRWLADRKFRSVRLVTSDWHMRRAVLELEKVRPQGVEIVADAVATQPSFNILFLEYHKLIARRLSWLWDA